MGLAFVGIGIAVGVRITFALLQQSGIRQTDVDYSDDNNSWLDPLFLKNFHECLRTGAHYKSKLAVGEDWFFDSNAKGGMHPHQFECKFGEGVVPTGVNVPRSFESPGVYCIKLTVTDAAGKHEDSDISIEVLPAEGPGQ